MRQPLVADFTAVTWRAGILVAAAVVALATDLFAARRGEQYVELLRRVVA